MIAWTLAAPAFGLHPLQFGGLMDGLLTLDGLLAFAAGVVGVGGIRYLLKRRRRSAVRTAVEDLLGEDASTSGGPGTTMRTSMPGAEPGHVIKQTAHGHAKKKNVAFTLPAFLPVSKGIRNVTHDEVHAVELGLAVGTVVVWLYSQGRIELTVSILAIFVAGALGYKRYRTKAFKTIRLEPWYALIAFGIGSGIGYLLFVAGVGLPLSVLP